MWEPFISIEQAILNCRIRHTIVDGSIQYETVYKIVRIGQFYFVAELMIHNGTKLDSDQVIIIPYRIQGIPFYGFEIRKD